MAATPRRRVNPCTNSRSLIAAYLGRWSKPASTKYDAQIIAAGLPGAGDLLVFDNQGPAGYPPAPLTVTGGSRVLEIDPINKNIVWQYTAEDSGQPGWAFRSTHISAARRLPNGNTFIDEGQSGRLFQVTPKGDIVWEYINAYPRVAADVDGRGTVNYQLYRAQPVPYDWVPAGTPHSERPVLSPVGLGHQAQAALP